MNLLIPANGIFQPFFLRKTESRLDLRTDIGFTDSPVQVSHENHGGNLLDQSTIDRIGLGQMLFPIVFIFFIRRISRCRLLGGIPEKYGGKINQQSFGLRGSDHILSVRLNLVEVGN